MRLSEQKWLESPVEYAVSLFKHVKFSHRVTENTEFSRFSLCAPWLCGKHLTAVFMGLSEQKWLERRMEYAVRHFDSGFIRVPLRRALSCSAANFHQSQVHLE
jgi:hypothetical protein